MHNFRDTPYNKMASIRRSLDSEVRWRCTVILSRNNKLVTFWLYDVNQRSQPGVRVAPDKREFFRGNAESWLKGQVGPTIIWPRFVDHD